MKIMFLKNPREISSATPPVSVSIPSCFGLGIILLVATLDWVQGAKASKADHPSFFKIFQLWIVILLLPWILTSIKKKYLNFRNICQIILVVQCPVLTKTTVFSNSLYHIILVRAPSSLESDTGPNIMRGHTRSSWAVSTLQIINNIWCYTI